MFYLGLLLSVCYVPGYTGASVPTQWAVLAAILPLGLWRMGPVTLGHKLFLIFIAYALLGAAWSMNPYSAVWGLFLIAIWALAFHWGTVVEDLTPFWKGLAIGLSANSAVALAQALDYVPVEVSDPNLPAGLFYNSALFGILLGLTLVSLASRKLWWYMPPLVLGLILSGSRGGILILAVGLVAHYGRWLAALALLTAGALALTYGVDPSDSQRLQIWGVTLSALTPFGHGPGSFVDLYYVRHTKLLLIHPEFVHNDVLQLAYEFGLGAAPIAALAALALGTTRAPDWPVACAFATACLFFFPLYTPLTAFIGLVVAGSCLRHRALVRADSGSWRSDFLPWLAFERSLSDRDGREAIPLVPRTTSPE